MKPPIAIVLQSISLKFISNCLMYFLVSHKMSMIHLICISLIIKKGPSNYMITFLNLKFVSSNSMTASVFLRELFAWLISFQSLSLCLLWFFNCIPCRQQNVGFIFPIHISTLYLFVGAFRLLTLRDITVMEVSAIFHVCLLLK